MAIMVHHHDAIIRDKPTMPEHNEYPKHMTHPGFEPATLGTEVKSGNYSHWVGGTTERFPPVLVNSPDDQEYYEAKGYKSVGKSDPAAFLRAHASAKSASGYTPIRYPMWAGGVLVNNEEEESAALGARREQLALEPIEPEAEQATPAPLKYAEVAAPAPVPDVTAVRLDAMEAQQARMMVMMEQMLALSAGARVQKAAPVATVEPEPEQTEADGMTRGQKAWATRQARAAEKAGEQAA